MRDFCADSVTDYAADRCPCGGRTAAIAGDEF